MQSYGTFKIFAEHSLSDMLRDKKDKIREKINSESENYLLNVGETNYVNYLVDENTVTTLRFNFDGIFASDSEEDIPAKYFPSSFYVKPGKKYQRQVIKYHIPVSGSTVLLHYTPSQRILNTYSVSLEDGCVCFKIINFSENPEQIQKEADSIIDLIKKQTKNINEEVTSFNESLETFINEIFSNRKKQLLKQKDLLSNLGVPIKKKTDIPDTYTVPTPETSKKFRITKPEVRGDSYKPEPTLEYEYYREMLSVINDLGKQFERLPSTYKGKMEEDLRDHFLLYLEPRFEGSSTGETFNKSGKTDILIRYNGENVFVAECKFWKGQKSYLNTIDQLLSYLTWRDSKCAIVLFLQNSDFSAVLEKIQESTPSHDNFIKFNERVSETFFEYIFHLSGDDNREVIISVLCFHLPR